MKTSNKRLILTGGTGLIGQEILEPLLDDGFEVYALTRAKTHYDKGIYWINCDIFNSKLVEEVLNDIKAEYLLHLAWVTTDDYLTSNINYDFLSASINLLNCFGLNGGKRVVLAGTCFEYEFKENALCENDRLDCDKTTYTFCKNKLREISERYCEQNGISFGYGRIFYVYGKNEKSTRLTGMLIDKLSRGEEVIIKSGSLLKDYIYTKDIACAFVKFLDSDVKGIVNIGSGKTIMIKDYVNLIETKLGKYNLVKYIDEPSTQPPIILANNSRLVNDVGYRIKYTLEQGIDEIIRGVNVR